VLLPSGTARAACWVLAAALGGAVPARAQERMALRVEAPPELEGQAATVRALGEKDVGALLELVGLPTPGAPVRVVLATERSSLAGNVASWVGGYAVPTLSTVVLFPARVPSYPDRSMDSLVRHEIAHVLIARAAHGGELPRWFDEGVATVAAREWGIEDGARAALAGVSAGPRTLGELSLAFSGGGAAASRAYATSAALVRELLRRRGAGVVATILARVAGGTGFDDAFEACAAEPPAAFARSYFRREALWTTWVPFLTSSTVLWMGITLLALAAIRRRRDRDAAQREAWALEEGRGAGGGDERDEDDPSRWN